MRRRDIFGLVAFLGALPSFAQAPADPIRQEVEPARQYALHYAASLPNFLCTQLIRRSGTYDGSDNWVPFDTLTVQVTYFEQREEYKVVSRGGAVSRQKYESLAGAVTKGEFGSALRWIFDPSAGADLQPQGTAVIGKSPVSNYSYRIDAAHSVYEIQASARSIITPFHGIVSLEENTHRVLRLTIEAEPPDDFPVLKSFTRVDYGNVTFGGHEYFLPVEAEVRVEERRLTVKTPGIRVGGRRPVFEQAIPGMKYRNLVAFRSYRKFTAESKLTFGRE